MAALTLHHQWLIKLDVKYTFTSNLTISVSSCSFSKNVLQWWERECLDTEQRRFLKLATGQKNMTPAKNMSPLFARSINRALLDVLLTFVNTFDLQFNARKR